MPGPDTDQHFDGAIPELYDQLLVPLIFAPYADDLARRVDSRRPANVLEIAAGTGVVTRRLAALLPASAAIIATDLNQSMLDKAAAIGTSRPVAWRQADAMRLPFADGSFDVVVCQFGVMFFPDKAKAFAQARRVLAPGGVFVFNVWDRIEDNAFADTVTTALASLFPVDPPRFMARTPHGHHDVERIRQELKAAGFADVAIDAVDARSRAPSARHVAIADCQGTPLRNEIEARDASRLEAATNHAADALAKRFGNGPIEGRIRAMVITATR